MEKGWIHIYVFVKPDDDGDFESDVLLSSLTLNDFSKHQSDGDDE